MAWYYIKDKERVGPVDDILFADLITQGVISPRTWVWRPGMKDWKAYRDITDEIISLQSEGATIPQSQIYAIALANYDNHVVEENVASLSSDGNDDPEKNVQDQEPNEATGTTAVVNVCFAGVWIRLCAAFCDFQLIFLGLRTIVRFLGFSVTQSLSFGFCTIQNDVFNVVVLAVLMALYAVYETWMVGRYGATLGKRVLGLMVVQSDGSPVPYMHVFMRCWVKILGGMLLGLGIVMAVFDREKRTLHDRVLGTRVMRIRRPNKE